MEEKIQIIICFIIILLCVVIYVVFLCLPIKDIKEKLHRKKPTQDLSNKNDTPVTKNKIV